MKNKISTLLLLLMTTGCKKFLEIPPPKGQPVTASVFADDKTASAALINIYGEMATKNASPFYVVLYTGYAGDELKNFSLGEKLQIYTNTINPSYNTLINSIWSSAYSYIYRANIIYEGCRDSRTLNADVRKQLMAEALFIRAYWHFYLLNLYGDIPFVAVSEFSTNETISRSTMQEVYDHIIEDLKAAQNDLNINYVGANNMSVSEERVRPNKAVATALLARVYLYTNRYKDAEEQASLLINASAVYALEAPDKVFLKESKEAIWQLMPPTPNISLINTIEATEFILTEPPQRIGHPAISEQLLHAFEAGDLRLKNWVGVYTDDTVNYYFPYKYKTPTGSGSREYSIVFRLAEQYLIRAEARAQLGKLSDAIQDVNVIRERAGLPLVANLNRDDLKKAILKERQTELFTEQGHRWFDLKRTGNINAVMQIVSPLKGGNWNTYMQLWPIPAIDIANDSYLKQNPGYN